MSDRDVMRQALEALTNCSSQHGHRCSRCDSEVDEGGRVVAALRAALAEPEPEPVANGWTLREVLFEDGEPIAHREPPARRPLTDEEIEALKAERDALRTDYGKVCGLVADMHAAATGRPGEGPRLGVVEDVAAVRAERDALRETERKFGTMMHAVMAERDALRATLSRVADVVHGGAMVTTDWLWLLVVIRRLTLPHFDLSGTTEQIKARVRAAIDAAKEAGK